jgi:hypothetical protein
MDEKGCVFDCSTLLGTILNQIVLYKGTGGLYEVG